ncbi:LOW QUALITY PROTEIN: uncharacterized protein C3orf36 [Piliocolobus tephrosceles]|uniref:LOW QUALITY PROTEIN: uncharacterized protein C3orf36 n=1 Tax=Piliocolobus tephrosceles TaxID=591936 RepID=UPI0013014700|nr:LOW QUALITY PROTEIN: uncharacterized protein C3orf36 [Piliocolobus tephrosceles]
MDVPFKGEESDSEEATIVTSFTAWTYGLRARPPHSQRLSNPDCLEPEAETILEGLEAGLGQAVSSGVSLVLAPGLVLTCPSAHSGPGGMASEPPPTRLRKAFLAQSTLLESPLEGAPEWAAPHPEEQRRSSSACSQHTPPLPSIPMAPPPCPPGENHPLCPRSGRGGGHCSIPPSLPSSSTFFLFSSGCWNPSVKVRVGKSQSQGRAGQLI